MAHQGLSNLETASISDQMAYLCNDWSFEAPMHTSECRPDSPLLFCNSAAGNSRVAPRAGPVRSDAVTSLSSSSVRHAHSVARPPWLPQLVMITHSSPPDCHHCRPASPRLLGNVDILADAPLKRPLDRWSALAQGPHLENAAPTHGTLQQKEFLTDDFRINSFKVTTHLMRNSLGGILTNFPGCLSRTPGAREACHMYKLRLSWPTR